MSNFFSRTGRNQGSGPKWVGAGRWTMLIAYSVALVVLTIGITLVVFPGPDENDQFDDDTTEPEDAPATSPGRPSSTAIEFGSQDLAVDSVTIPANTQGAVLLPFDVDIETTSAAAPRAAMVAFRVECQHRNERAEMQADGKVSTNVFLSHGGKVSGQALTAPTENALECTLLASAPYIETTDDGLTSLPVEAELRTGPADGAHLLALHRLDAATLVNTGSVQNVLSLKVEDPATLDKMSTTVRLTSCTVVGGSRDGGEGEDKCLDSMTGRESSTVRIRVIARWLDADGDITGTTTYWDETLAVDYNTHHVPWTLRQGNMAERVPDTAHSAVMVVQVDSLAGTPFVVHADGTDSIITTGS